MLRPAEFDRQDPVHAALRQPEIGLSQLRRLEFSKPESLIQYFSSNCGLPAEAFSVSVPDKTGAGRGHIGLESHLGSYTFAELEDVKDEKTGKTRQMWKLTEPALILLLKGTKDELAFDPDEVARTRSIGEVRQSVKELATRHLQRGYRPEYFN